MLYECAPTSETLTFSLNPWRGAGYERVTVLRHKCAQTVVRHNYAMSVYEFSLQDTIRTVLEITIELQKTSSPRLRIFLRKVSAVDVAAGREDNFATHSKRYGYEVQWP